MRVYDEPSGAHAWIVGPGDPLRGTGLSGAMPLVLHGQPIGSPGGTPNKDTDRLFSLSGAAGMPYTGIDRDRALVWVVVKSTGQFDNSATTRVGDMRTMFLRLGVTDVLVWDGADSATLVIDDRVIERPASYKDNSIPFGLHFVVQHGEERAPSQSRPSETR